MTGVGGASSRPGDVKASVLVERDTAATFDSFVDTIADWWPVVPLSQGQRRVRDVTVERRPAGRVYETWDDGTTVPWGVLLDWSPPTAFTLRWDVLPKPTVVALDFRCLGPNLTRVTLTHSGWEAFSAAEIASATGYEGGYERGWLAVLAAFKAFAEGVREARINDVSSGMTARVEGPQEPEDT